MLCAAAIPFAAGKGTSLQIAWRVLVTTAGCYGTTRARRMQCGMSLLKSIRSDLYRRCMIDMFLVWCCCLLIVAGVVLHWAYHYSAWLAAACELIVKTGSVCAHMCVSLVCWQSHMVMSFILFCYQVSRVVVIGSGVGPPAALYYVERSLNEISMSWCLGLFCLYMYMTYCGAQHLGSQRSLWSKVCASAFSRQVNDVQHWHDLPCAYCKVALWQPGQS